MDAPAIMPTPSGEGIGRVVGGGTIPANGRIGCGGETTVEGVGIRWPRGGAYEPNGRYGHTTAATTDLEGSMRWTP